jgi:hypothetical protein
MGRFLCFLIIASLFVTPLSAQEFGFGFDDSEGGTPSLEGEGSGPVAGDGMGSGGSGAGGMGGIQGVSIHGEVSASMTGYLDDFSEDLRSVKLGDIFSGKLHFSAAVSIAEGIIKLQLIPKTDPVLIDEAYIRAYLGSFEMEAGLRKLTWGKADSFGPLDVINPLDSSEIYPKMADNMDLMDLKIARPMVHLSFRFGQFSKLEGVFVPAFEPHRFASSGRWAPAGSYIGTLLTPPDTTGLDYAQAGLRFTTTIGSSDMGAQYYYGRLPRPAVYIGPASISLRYNPYHQIGFDFARVLYGFNLRAEFAANITEDIKGDDGSVYNPALAWSLGFDRDLFLGINLNVQADETIRLMNGKVGSADIMSGSFDTEGGTDPTATRITASLSHKFLREELELRAAVVWEPEARDFVIMPALIWAKDDLKATCALGIFGGDKEGQLGQYYKNNFVKLGIAYSF